MWIIFWTRISLYMSIVLTLIDRAMYEGGKPHSCMICGRSLIRKEEPTLYLTIDGVSEPLGKQVWMKCPACDTDCYPLFHWIEPI